MLWLEMSRDETHGGGGWSFTKCLWSPTHKRDGSRWAFWDTLMQVKKGDQVLHLRGVKPHSLFVGYSTAELDGYVADSQPPEPLDWGYGTNYYRVPLTNFTPFPEQINLQDVFDRQEVALRNYFENNKLLPSKEKKRLFYVIQSGRLQCLNGAYLSEVGNTLAQILLGNEFNPQTKTEKTIVEVTTGEAIRNLGIRVGQAEFSNRVRDNYDRKCCFPGCSIAEDKFIIGAHIARWADAPELRGQVSNGLCLCLMHDKAFESGYFTISEEYTIVVNREQVYNSAWCIDNLLPYEGMKIKLGLIPPSDEALLHHWIRTNFY